MFRTVSLLASWDVYSYKNSEVSLLKELRSWVSERVCCRAGFSV